MIDRVRATSDPRPFLSGDFRARLDRAATHTGVGPLLAAVAKAPRHLRTPLLVEWLEDVAAGRIDLEEPADRPGVRDQAETELERELVEFQAQRTAGAQKPADFRVALASLRPGGVLA